MFPFPRTRSLAINEKASRFCNESPRMSMLLICHIAASEKHLVIPSANKQYIDANCKPILKTFLDSVGNKGTFFQKYPNQTHKLDEQQNLA